MLKIRVKSISFFTILFLGFLLSVKSTNAQTPVEKYGQLSVKGNRIVDKNGNPVQLRGMSLYWSQWKPAFYNAACIKWLKDDWCVSVVRAAMAVNSGGLATNPNEKQKIYTVIDACIANGIYVIVDYHDHNANSNMALAQSFFDEVSKKYSNVPNILYETWNEPLQVSWGSVIKPYHQTIVDVIRKNDPDNIIICGTANWSQKVGDPASDPVAGKNIAYTLHYYAASHKQWLRDVATAAMNKGIALFVTEYGTSEASGNGVLDAMESKLWWDFLEKNFIGHCNWSAADLGETSAALKTGTGATGNWPASALKPSGILVRDYLRSKCNTTIVTSIEENTSATVKLFPNPFQNTFTINSDVNFEYQICNLSGVLIEKGDAFLSAEVGSNLEAGMYLLKIICKERNQILKIYKQ
ncbi:MAG: cellulase family glycosylhydrolase [Burkholderiales bacterium]|nr:cellulase family glycosylhydrolase [Bacteroidia bacterium]